MNLDKLKDTARKHEQKEDWRKAIEVYQRVLQAFESGEEAAPDLALYNKVGDLHLKVGDIPAAVRSYERAVELYSEQGFSNNAIAVCGKILRYDPHRTRTYIQLARLHAKKNMAGEAKKNLIEYLERMNREGLRDDAFRDVKAFADQFASSDEIRIMLAELLRVASRGAEAREQLEKLASDLESRGDQAGAQRTRDRMNEIESSNAPAPPPEEAPRRRGDLVFLDIGLDTPFGSPTGFGAPTREVRLVEEPDAPPPSLDPPTGEVTISASDLMQSDLEDTEAEEFDVVPVEGLERVDAGALDEMEILPVDPDLVADQTHLDPEEAPPPLDGFEPGTADDTGTVPLIANDVTGLVSDLTIDLTTTSQPDEDAPERIEEEPLLGDLEVSIETDQESYAVEVPPVWDVDDPALELVEEPDGVDGPGTTEVVEESPEARVSALEDRVLDDPDNPDVHRALGEALLSLGQHERGIEELDLALRRLEELEDWDRANDVAEELARLEPSEIRYFQKLVEFAYRVGHRGRVVEAYLELGDALVRVGAVEKALAVYGRVAESEPDNARARAAIDSLAPPPAPTPPVVSTAPAPPPSEEFVDLGAMLLDADAREKPKDTRMRVQDEEPTGDEERDFAEMLKQFKRGLDENLEDEDYQSHYDLGIAFKEMGLLDEAIAEFQKALRSPDARLRTSEALGSSFFDKGQFAVAEAILRRAVDGLSGQDNEKIGLLYWLGRALEAEGRGNEARPYYERALAVDVKFMDLNDRLRAILKGGGVTQAIPATLADIQAPVRARLEEVRSELRRIVEADFGLIAEVNAHLLQMQGKMLRPTLLLLADEATGEPDERAPTLGAVVELIHLATLVHDDSVDHSVRRRGMPTINALFSHQVSVIMGDYLYSRAVIELVRLADLEPLRILGRVTNEMTVGEMRQLLAHDRLAFSEEQYDLLITAKTASLLSGACETGAIRAPAAQRQAMREFGLRLGMAFQIVDDLLDYTGDASVTGKPVGADLREHKVTLPLIYALPRLSSAQRREVSVLMETEVPSDEQIAAVVEAVTEAGGLDYARERAHALSTGAEEVLEALAPSPAREALRASIPFVLDRRS